MAERSFVFRTQTSVMSKAPPEAVYDTIIDLKAHLVWSGDRATDDAFKLLSLQTSDEAVRVGTTFNSTGGRRGCNRRRRRRPALLHLS